MLDVNIHKTNKVVLGLKRKKEKARTKAKKSNNTAFVRGTKRGYSSKPLNIALLNVF